MTPLVSVVVSVYNGERYLRVSLESVLAQEGVDLEVLVVDDGSSDATPKIAAEYEKRDARVRCIRQDNTGLTRALARGCAEARGTYIARQDDDDVSAPGRLVKLASTLDASPGVAVVASWVDVIGPGGEFLHTIEYPEGAVAGTEAVLVHGRNPVHGATMFRKADYESVGGYRPEFYFAQDADLWLRLAGRGEFLFVPEVLYRFRVQDGSISTHHREAQRRLHALAQSCRDAREAGAPEDALLAEAAGIRPVQREAARSGKGSSSYFIGRTLYRNGDARALPYLKAFVRQQPLSAKGWVSLALAAVLLRGSETR